MRSVLLLVLCLGYFAKGQDINAMRDMPKYDSRYDYLDVDAILDSKRLVKNYVECLINSQRCTPEGKALKRLLPEALRTKCVRCTEKQKRTAVKVIKRLKYEYPDEWAKLSSRWDPTGDFTRYFEEFLAKEHFNTIYGNGPDLPVSSTLPPPPPPTAPPTPEPEPPSSPSPPPVDVSTPAKPVILNRFGDDGELMMVSPSGNGITDRPGMSMPTEPNTFMRPISTTVRPLSTRPTTPMTWMGAASDSQPTRFPLRPNPPAPGYTTVTDPQPTRFPLRPMPPVYTTAITFIDQLSYKIMRTTELVSDILRNTVRAVVG